MPSWRSLMWKREYSRNRILPSSLNRSDPAQNSILAHTSFRSPEDRARRPGLASLSSVAPLEWVESAPSHSLNANDDDGEARKPAGRKKPPVEGDKANQQ